MWQGWVLVWETEHFLIEQEKLITQAMEILMVEIEEKLS